MPAYYGRGLGQGGNPLEDEELLRRYPWLRQTGVQAALSGSPDQTLGVPMGPFGSAGQALMPGGQVVDRTVPSSLAQPSQLRAVSPLQQMHPIPPREATAAAPTVPRRPGAEAPPTDEEGSQASVMESVGKALSRIGKELGKPEVRESMARLGMSLSKKEPKQWQYQVSEQMKEKATSEQEKSSSQQQSKLYSQYIQQLSTGKGPSGEIGQDWSPLQPPAGLDPALSQQALQAYLQYGKFTGREQPSLIESGRLELGEKELDAQIAALEAKRDAASGPDEARMFQAQIDNLNARTAYQRELTGQLGQPQLAGPMSVQQREQGLNVLMGKYASRADPNTMALSEAGGPAWLRIFSALPPGDQKEAMAEAQAANVWLGGTMLPGEEGPPVPEGLQPPPSSQVPTQPIGPALAGQPAPVAPTTGGEAPPSAPAEIPAQLLQPGQATPSGVVISERAKVVRTPKAVWQEWREGGSLYRYMAGGPDAGKTIVQYRPGGMWTLVEGVSTTLP